MSRIMYGIPGNPFRYLQVVVVMAELDDRTMRVMGLFSMLLGLGLLYLIN